MTGKYQTKDDAQKDRHDLRNEMMQKFAQLHTDISDLRDHIDKKLDKMEVELSGKVDWKVFATLIAIAVSLFATLFGLFYTLSLKVAELPEQVSDKVVNQLEKNYKFN